MPELIDSYDSYKDFGRNAYFTICYNVIPSNLLLEIPLEESEENMKNALGLIDFDATGMELVFKNWDTENTKKSDDSKDYPYEYLFKGKTKKIILWISLGNDELTVDFLYDVKDTALENWILSTDTELRTILGMDKISMFKVLSRSNHSFFTEDVKIENFELDLDRMYNDDFKEVNEIILESLVTDKAGLILLYGTSGTGKTSYIKA